MQTKSYADADADGIHTKNNMSPTPSEGGHKNTLIGYIKIDVRLFFLRGLFKAIITTVKTKLTLGAKLKLKKEKHRQKSQQLQIIDEGKPQALCGGNQCPDSTAPAAYSRPPKN